MRTTIRNYIQAEKIRREENGEAGFSLIELIVVVVILGILAAVAIPVFLGLQAQAAQSAQDAVAANAATQYAAAIANDALDDNDFANLEDGDTYTIVATGTDLDTFFVTVTSDGVDEPSVAGPGASLPTPAPSETP